LPAAPTSTGMWDCTGLGQAQLGPNLTKLAVVFGFFLGPQGAHGLEVLAQHRAAAGRRYVVVGELVGVPAESDAEADPATGQVIERGDRLGQRDAVVLDGQGDRGGQSYARGHSCGATQTDPWVQRAHVAVVGQGLVAGGRVRGLPLDRDVGVFGHVEGVKPMIVGQFRGRCGRDTAVAGEKYEPVVHTQN